MTHRILVDDSGLLATDELGRLKSNLDIALDFIAETEEAGKDFELSVTFVNDSAIQEMNRDYRAKNAPTDVLSFSQYEGEPVPTADGVQSLGDLVISVDTARRQSEEIGHSGEFELNRLLVHGLYHLLGYDHETSREDEEVMQSREDALLARLEEAGEIP